MRRLLAALAVAVALTCGAAPAQAATLTAHELHVLHLLHLHHLSRFGNIPIEHVQCNPLTRRCPL